MDFISGLMKEESKTKDDIALAKAGSKAAFERLIAANEASLCRVGKGILKTEDDVEDAYQETIIKAYRGIVHLKRNEFFRTWLIKIMINECNSILRHRKRMLYLEESMAEEIAEADSSEKLELWNAVSKLEEELRIVTVLYYYEDLMQNDIAQLLNIPYGTVKSRLSRAKEKLRQLLEIKL